MRRTLAFWIDPLDSLKVGHDTTFALMLEAQARGHEVLTFESGDVYVQGGRALCRMKAAWLYENAAHRADLIGEYIRPISSVDAVFLRKDPPVDTAYVHVTQMLEMTAADAPPLYLNAPSALRDFNEKLFAARFPELCPRTLVSANVEELEWFRSEVGDVVVKPIDGFGGKGVFLISVGDRNAATILETSTLNGQIPVVMQEFLAASEEGDKRILVLGGEPIGAILRVGDAFRCNLAAGGHPVKTAVSDEERELCRALAPTLKREGLHFVGIDVIGGKLTEINVTSPTGLVEVNHADGVHLETEVLAYVEAQLERPEKRRLQHQREQVAEGMEERGAEDGAGSLAHPGEEQGREEHA